MGGENRDEKKKREERGEGAGPTGHPGQRRHLGRGAGGRRCRARPAQEAAGGGGGAGPAERS